MAVSINMLEGGTHGATVTGSSTAAGGAQLSIAGATGITVTWDQAHHAIGDQSVKVGASATSADLRQIVLADSTSPTSGVMSVLFMLAGLPTSAGHTLAMIATSSSTIITATILPSGQVRFLAGATTLATSTNDAAGKVVPWRWYRLEMGYDTTSNTCKGSVTAVTSGVDITDSSFTSTAATISSKVCNGVQVGKVSPGVTDAAWFDALRFETGTTTLAGAWEPSVPAGVAARASQVIVNSGSTSMADAAGQLGDADDTTTVQFSQGGSFDLAFGNLRTTGADITFALSGISGGGTLRPLVDGVLVGSAKAVAASVTFTNAELGSPPAGKLITARIVPA